LRGLSGLLQAGSKRTHQIEDVAGGGLFGGGDRLALLLLLEQFLQRRLVTILEFFRVEVAGATARISGLGLGGVYLLCLVLAAISLS
jgi:hypothetical protein